METLLRFTSRADRPKLATIWFPNYALVQFLLVRIKDFKTGCLNFLTCQVGEQQMSKPPDNKYRQFWVEFNLRSGSIGIFHVKEEQSTDLWDLLTISQYMVTPASINT